MHSIDSMRTDPSDQGLSHIELAQQRRWLLPQAWGGCLLLLVAGTYRLWLSWPRSPDLLSIPLVRCGIPIPGWFLLALSIALIAGLLLAVVSPQRCRWAWWLVGGALLASFLADQHRLQPWAYQGAAYALAFAAMDPRAARRWLIPLAASVYIYSAAGKFDFQFAHTVGQDFLGAVFDPLGGLPEALSVSTRAKLALILPATELLAGIGLLFQGARKASAVVIMLIHASLFAILGPWGLDHSAGVLIWNLALIAQAYLLMIRPVAPESSDADAANSAPSQARAGARRRRTTARLVQCLIIGALAAPLLERSGYWDHWPSWSLYSPHTSRVEIELHGSALDRLDPGLRTFAQEDADGDGWRRIDIERWSLQSRGVPIYPQARYQLAVAARIAEEYQLDDEIRARVRGVADRWTGERAERWLASRGEIEQQLTSYWLIISD